METKELLDEKEEILTSEVVETKDVSTILNYKAITKVPIMPTRNNGMGKIMIEIIDFHMLSNTLLMRDWVVVQDEFGVEVFKEPLKDVYSKSYSDEQLSQMFNMSGVDINKNPLLIYKKLKEIIDVASLMVNNYDPPYGLAQNSFEKYVDIKPKEEII